MSAIAKDAFIPDAGGLALAPEFPPGTPTGDVVVALTVKAKDAVRGSRNRMAESGIFTKSSGAFLRVAERGGRLSESRENFTVRLDSLSATR